jgi:hypothetical protein
MGLALAQGQGGGAFKRLYPTQKKGKIDIDQGTTIC